MIGVVKKRMFSKPKKNWFAFLKNIKPPKLPKIPKLKKTVRAPKLPKLLKFPKLPKLNRRGPKEQPVNKGKHNKLNFFKLLGGIRGRIILLVMIMALIPLSFLTYFSVNSQTAAIISNMNELNKAVNLGLIERINAEIEQIMNSLELVPQSVDLLAMDSYQQERVIRKIASSRQSAYKEITLADANGQVLYSMNSKLNGTSIAEERWYKEALRGENFISDSYVDVKLHAPVYNISVPVLDHNMTVAGVLGAKIVMDDIQAIINQTKIGEKGIAYIIDRNGIVLAHPEYGAMVLKSYNTVENMIEGPACLVKGQTGTLEYENVKGEEVIGTYYKIPATGWGLITEIGVNEALTPVKTAKKNAYVLIAIAFVLSLVGSLFLAVIIVKPLVNMSKIADEIKDGNLKKRLAVTSKDEIGELQSTFNLMTESLSTILGEVNAAVSEITEASQKLSESAHISTAATEEITAIVEDVAGGAESQMASIAITAEVVREITSSVDKASGKALEAADTANNAAAIAQEGSKNIAVITDTIEMIKNNVVSSSNLVEKLGNTSAEVNGIVKTIKDIAGTTNMLALNAAIEAARAGDAGKGFAVVANEIRNLAEQTRNASKGIETLLMEIQSETKDTVTAMNEGLVEVEKGTEAISSTYSIFEKIINEIHRVSEEVRTTSDSVLELKDENSKVIDAVKEVSAIAETTSSGTQNVLAATEEQSSAAQEINILAVRLSEMSTTLQAIINKFTY